jgi:hypothetical protein
MEKSTVIALALAPVIGPVIGYLLFRPARGISRWIWRKMPEGRLRSLLLKRIGDDKPTWPRLPPGP